MRYFANSISRYHTFFVTPSITAAGIRLGYKHICNVLGMHEDKRKCDRTAAEQRAVSGYGRFISQCLGGPDRWNTVYTVSDLNLGRVCVFVFLDTEAENAPFGELSNLAHRIGFSWKPPFERLLDKLALARGADVSAASDTLAGPMVELISSLPHWELLPYSFNALKP